MYPFSSITKADTSDNGKCYFNLLFQESGNPKICKETVVRSEEKLYNGGEQMNQTTKQVDTANQSFYHVNREHKDAVFCLAFQDAEDQLSRPATSKSLQMSES